MMTSFTIYNDFNQHYLQVNRVKAIGAVSDDNISNTSDTIVFLDRGVFYGGGYSRMAYGGFNDYIHEFKELKIINNDIFSQIRLINQ